MTDQYAVIGNPIGHSKSPLIHTAFAKQTQQDISYKAILAPLDAFELTICRLMDEGYQGVNVTVPFKLQAFLMSDTLSSPAQSANAVNTLLLNKHNIIGHNTDGIGLVNDISNNLGINLQGKRILLLGAGGAAQGVLLPLFNTNPASILVANRNGDKAKSIVEKLSLEKLGLEKLGLEKLNAANVTSCDFSQLQNAALTGSFDVIINATSTGLHDDRLLIPDSIFNVHDCLAYDMMYGVETQFMAQARCLGAQVVDGLGMLVEQAAEAFYLWRNVRPETVPVIAQLRQT